jgi:spermidine synthase|tara:strand:+ start:4791 stop:6695 length:1905 start_codon:yes stop_codon:yes gene_type:complete
MATERITTSTSPVSHASVVNVYLLSLILSACSLLYELLIAQTLTTIVGNMVIWYSLTVGTYLAAMGIGAIFYHSNQRVRGWSSLFHVEIILSLVGALAVILLRLAHSIYMMFDSVIVATADAHLALIAFFAFAFILTFLIGFLTGMELPLLINLGNILAGKRHVTNRVLGWDYMGSLVAGLAFPLYLLPFFQLHTIGFLIAGLNLTVAVYILWRFLSHTSLLKSKTKPCLVLAGMLMIGCYESDPIEQFFLKKYYYTNTLLKGQGHLLAPLSETPPIFRVNSPYQTIDIVHFPHVAHRLMEAYSTKFALNSVIPHDYALFLNGDFQFFSNEEELYHEWLAHVPVIVNGKVPKRVLILGGGDGILHRELLKYKQVESITHVDIDRNLIELARTHPLLTVVNGHSFDDPRVHTIFADAFQYLRQYEGESYDAIYMDFPDVKDYNLSKLYSREFFYFANMRLKDDGFLALDAPDVYYGTPRGTSDLMPRHRGDWAILSNTMRLAGFKTLLPFYTMLEIDNRKAYDKLAGSDAQKKWNYLKRYSAQMQEGFILLRKDERYGPFKYIDFGVKLHILNERRFQLSFPEIYRPMQEVDYSQVNSILRPTLPDGKIWSIRNLKHDWEESKGMFEHEDSLHEH